MKRSSLLAAGAALAAGASAALLGAGYAIYRTWFHRTAQPEVLTTDEWERTVPYGAQMHADAAALAAAPYEPVQITADDGVPLAARCYHHADGASGGQSITLGVKERYDCRAWAYWAYQHFGPDTPLFLMGVSMGAATVLLAAGLDLPPTVRGIMADCGYTSPREVIHQYLPRYLPGLPVGPVGPVYAVGRLGTRLFGHFDPEDADCRAALAKATVPVLLIHGEADSFVPCAMSRENFDACAAPKRLVTIPGAGHAVAYYVDIPGYERAVTDFMRGCLSKETKQGAAPPFFIFIFSFSKLPLGCTLPAMRVQ